MNTRPVEKLIWSEARKRENAGNLLGLGMADERVIGHRIGAR
jgi:hypothetical protein